MTKTKMLYILGWVAAFAIAAVLVYTYLNTPMITSTQITPDVKAVTVQVPDLSTKNITTILTDPKDAAIIKNLMAENAKLKLKVSSLTSSVATYASSGSGHLTTPITLPGVIAVLPSAPQSAKLPETSPIHFQDWRLDFRSNGVQADYDLTQKFEILTTTGKDAAGQQASLVKLFELGAKGERIPVTDVKTTGIFADPTALHWLVSLAVQGGLAFTSPLAQAQGVNGAVVGLQWLKRGTSPASGDTTYAVATPVLFIGATTKELGLLPVSVNLGKTIPHQPFQNLWVSPYVSQTRIGVAATVTF